MVDDTFVKLVNVFQIVVQSRLSVANCNIYNIHRRVFNVNHGYLWVHDTEVSDVGTKIPFFESDLAEESWTGWTDMAGPHIRNQNDNERVIDDIITKTLDTE